MDDSEDRNASGTTQARRAGPAVDWADVVTQAYAAVAKPPLTAELEARVRDLLAGELDSGTGDVSNSATLALLNSALDGFEAELRSVVGPRIASLDGAAGTVVMEHRSEAGQPLRAFGGQ